MGDNALRLAGRKVAVSLASGVSLLAVTSGEQMVEIGWVQAALLAGVVGIAAMPVAWAGCDAGLPQQGLNDCAFREFEAADAALNATYRRIVARLAGRTEARQLLTKAQRAWVAFRTRNAGSPRPACRAAASNQ